MKTASKAACGLQVSSVNLTCFQLIYLLKRFYDFTFPII